MNAIYKFELSDVNTTNRAYPIYNDNLSKDFEMESGQRFFREKLSGELTFVGADYMFIVSRPFDTKFDLKIYISYDAGVSWKDYWTGFFFKTDCNFNVDSETVVVKPSVKDCYENVLAGLNKEFNLIELAPKIVPVRADKRPMIQVYVTGQSVIGCYLTGMWWEEECNVVDSDADLVNKYHFALNKSQRIIDVSQTGVPEIPISFTTLKPENPATAYNIVEGDYKFNYIWLSQSDIYIVVMFQIIRISDDVVMWQYIYEGRTPPIDYPLNVTLEPVEGSGATGTVDLYIHDINIYSRIVLDKKSFISNLGEIVEAFEIETDDIVADNRNYKYVVEYNKPSTIVVSTEFVSAPTQWGLWQPGKYYYNPADNPFVGFDKAYPIARSAWGRSSLWFVAALGYEELEMYARHSFIIRHAYPISSVISVLLKKIASEITHEDTVGYSEFLYGENLIGLTQTLLITPKSNIVSSGYDQPAQKAPITLNDVLTMLRDCFRCYWFIDEQNRFRIEHVKYFENGGSYSDLPGVGVDLVSQINSRNGKSWSFAKNQYKFDKPEMISRYEFAWMDDVTQDFEGNPIDIVSNYVEPGKIEQISVAKFTSDIDYIMLNPSVISKDGFVLLSAITTDEVLEVTPTPNIELPGTFDISLRSELVNGGNIDMTINVIQRDSSCFTLFQFLRNGDVKKSQGFNWGSVGVKDFTFMNVPAGCDTLRIVAENGGPMTISIQSVRSDSEILNLPYVDFGTISNPILIQNAYVAFRFLQNYYEFDMPAAQYEVNGERRVAKGVKKLKTQQIIFPAKNDPDLFKLVKTNLGNGVIEKMSVNLSSRIANVVLKYDTE